MKLQSIKILLKTQLWAQILVAMVLGVGTGLLLSPDGAAIVATDTAYKIAHWLHLPGGIFLNLIQMVVIPLIVSSVILGICNSKDQEQLRRMGFRVFPYFIFTTCVAVSIGIILSLIISPGKLVDAGVIQSLAASYTPPTGLEGLSNIKENIPHKIVNLIPSSIDETLLKRDMLGIVVYAIIIGIALLTLRSKKSVGNALGLLEVLQDVSLKVVGWAMLLAPYAVFGLLADISLKVGVAAIVGISAYIGTVILGLFVLLLFYLCLVFFIANMHPIKFLKEIRDVQVLAFSTSSSAAVMPLSLQAAEKKLKVSGPLANFIIPLGATINMDGTALYQVIAAIFITHLFGIDLTLTQTIVLAITTVGASIGSPSTPGVGVVILATILQSLGVPVGGGCDYIRRR